MSTSQSTGRIVSIERLRSSVSGNPRFNITLRFEGGTRTWATAADHAFNYEIGNPGFRDGCDVTVTIGGRGTITGIAVAK